MAAALGTGACSGSGEAIGAAKNLLLITLDTTRADHLSCLGGDAGSTSRMDALAGRSTLFTFAARESNVTNPSHISIMTGLPAIEHRVISNTALVPRRVDTLAEGLQRGGYDTAAFLAVNHLASVGWRGFETLPDVERILDGSMVTERALEWLHGVRDMRYARALCGDVEACGHPGLASARRS
ncbi:MAG: arylsulfatase A-like enzyme [Chlamydiales bacterium]|jgi:arylsulfatase A-like enzyme